MHALMAAAKTFEIYVAREIGERNDDDDIQAKVDEALSTLPRVANSVRA